MKVLIFLVLSSSAYAHLILNEPQTWGISNSIQLEEPLDINTQNPICAGKSPENNGVVRFEAGKTYNLDIGCGEQNVNSPGCLVGDWHSGDSASDYSGCGLAVNYVGYQQQSDYKYIGYSKDCAKRGTPTSFVISKNVRNCEKCVCSWSWAPSRKYSSPPQFYHNCFYCSISGGVANATMRPFDFINIKNAKYQDSTYNEINPSNIYDNLLSSNYNPPLDESENSESGSNESGSPLSESENRSQSSNDSSLPCSHSDEDSEYKKYVYKVSGYKDNIPSRKNYKKIISKNPISKKKLI